MSLIKNTSIYLTSNMLNAAIPFLLLPVLTRYLTTAEFGQIAMFQTLLIGISALIGLNAVGSANRKFYDVDLAGNTLKEFNGVCIQVLFVSSIITTFLMYIAINQLTDFLIIPSSWIFLAVIVSVCTFIVSLRLGQWQIRNKAKLFGLFQVSKSIVNMLFSILFVVLLSRGAEGRIDAQVIAIIAAAIVSLCLLYKDKLIHVFVWRPYYLKEILQFGVPLVPHTLSFFLIHSVDRFIINKDLGIELTGIYMLAFQISTALSVIFDAINKAYVPWLFSKMKLDLQSDKIRIVKYTYGYFLLLIPVALCAFIIGPSFIVFFAGEKYRLAGAVIGWLCLGQIFGGMYLMVTNFVFYNKKTGLLSFVTTFCGLLNVILLLNLVPHLGIIGAAYSFSISRFMQFLLTFILASYLVDMPWFSFNVKNKI